MAIRPPSTSVTRKFLVVDDHAGFRQTIRAFLPPGSVTECADGDEVLACYSTLHPDWVLMDIEMAGMDGFTATHQLRQHFPDARVIIISNHGEEEFRNKAREMGSCGYVLKDHLEQLAEIIADADGG